MPVYIFIVDVKINDVDAADDADDTDINYADADEKI